MRKVPNTNDNSYSPYGRVEEAIAAIKAGKMIILLDDESRENEGDIVFAAQYVDADKINFMAKHARGLICLPLGPDWIERLELPLMKDEKKRGCQRDTAFTVSIEARTGVTTGISAADRARTIAVAIDDNVKPEDLVVPGHIFPLRSQPGGVLKRAGHTEGSVDLSVLAGLKAAAVICEIMNDDGSMARNDDLEILARRFELPMVTIPELIRYRLERESHISTLETRDVEVHGVNMQAHLVHSKLESRCFFALVKGQPKPESLTNVRVHVPKPIGDLLTINSTEISVGQLDRILLEFAQKSEPSVLVLLSEEDSEAALRRDFLKFVTPDEPELLGEFVSSTGVPFRKIGVGSQILRHFGVGAMRLFVGFPGKDYAGLTGFGLSVVEERLFSDMTIGG